MPSEANQDKRFPGFRNSVAALGVVIFCLFMSIMVFKISIQAGLLAAVVCVTFVSRPLGYRFEDLLKFAIKALDEASGALWIFLLIGTIIGTWMMSGTVPAVIYYGLGVITPAVFLPAGLVLCSLTSLATGTSWGTMGTIGIALLGMGQGLGIPTELTVGMIISGACFGDKMSPISDTTNLCAVASGADLYASIRAMVMTMTPAYLIAMVIYTVVGLKYGNGAADFAIIEETRSVLAENFNMNPLVMTPILVLLILNVLKMPAVPAMACGTFAGVVVAVAFQGETLGAALEAMNSGFVITTGSEFVDPILNRGGVQSMMYTFSLAFIAISLGGIMAGVGYMKVIVEQVISRAKSVGRLAASVIGTSFLSSAMLGEDYLSLILNGNLYKEEFDRRGLSRPMLARLVSEGGMMMAPLIPWTTVGAFARTTLGVQGFGVSAYSFLNIINPVVSVALASLGIFVLRNDGAKKENRILKKRETFLNTQEVSFEAAEQAVKTGERGFEAGRPAGDSVGLQMKKMEKTGAEL